MRHSLFDNVDFQLIKAKHYYMFLLSLPLAHAGELYIVSVIFKSWQAFYQLMKIS